MLAIADGKWYNGFELVSLGTMSSTCPVPQSRDVDAISVNKKVKGVFAMPTLEMIQQAVQTAAMQYPVKSVELFGSYANGTADEGSDVDFLVEFSENPTSLLHICGFRETLSELLNRDVDIVKLPRKQNDGLTIDRTVHIYGA
ncbi:MAG: nucleotidyltransferase domain-containing protein [Clostridia bacterium]|nr:nucleotidyltransferase domain-containing protein [Clostridia bacterium]MBQ6122673.1 nucleotidyltransferase domain-containing protein [Clostridia bacterium]